MNFNKHATVFGCCKRLQNISLNRTMQLDEGLRREKGELKLKPGVRILTLL